jgi:hypothetical protein
VKGTTPQKCTLPPPAPKQNAKRTSASRRRASRLSSALLPTLGRPTSATFFEWGGGVWGGGRGVGKVIGNNGDNAHRLRHGQKASQHNAKRTTGSSSPSTSSGALAERGSRDRFA